MGGRLACRPAGQSTLQQTGVQARTPICAWRAPWGLACDYQPPCICWNGQEICFDLQVLKYSKIDDIIKTFFSFSKTKSGHYI
jgi:hypothetical protein